MVDVYKTNGAVLEKLDEPEDGAWIKITDSDPEELAPIAKKYHIDMDDMKAALDEEEKSRIIIEDDYVMILMDIPVKEIENRQNIYVTIPLAIILVDEVLITICSEDTSILNRFINTRVRYFSTKKRTRFLYLIMLYSMIHFQEVLRSVDQRRIEIEARVGAHKENDRDLIELYNMGSTLVYFETSLRANSLVLDRLEKIKRIQKYEDDEDLFYDAVVECKQAIETTTIYRSIIDGTSNLITNVINNRLNNMMKILTSITLVMAVPTIISGLYGMNVNAEGMPFAMMSMGFGLICLLTTLICVVLLVILRKKNML